MSNGNTMIFLLRVGLIKNIFLYIMSCFPAPYIRSKNKMKVELDLFNYATNSDLKTQEVLIHQILPKR